MVSCLEIVSIDARHTQIIRSDYQSTSPYINMTGNMTTVKDLSMKGTLDGGHTHWLPDCTGAINTFTKMNFNTSVESNLGNIADNQARRESMVRSLYNAENPYGAIDTTANVLEGQYVIS